VVAIHFAVKLYSYIPKHKDLHFPLSHKTV